MRTREHQLWWIFARWDGIPSFGRYIVLFVNLIEYDIRRITVYQIRNARHQHSIFRRHDVVQRQRRSVLIFEDRECGRV